MEKQILFLVKWAKIAGLTLLMLGTVLKSVFFHKLIAKVPFGSNFLIASGCIILSIYFLITSFRSKKILNRLFKLGFCIFLISSVFVFIHFPGVNIMLSISAISAIFIFVLIILLFLNISTQIDNENFKNDLLIIVLVMFLIVFYLVSFMIYHNFVFINH